MKFNYSHKELMVDDLMKWAVRGLYAISGLGVTDLMDMSDAPHGDISLDDIFGDGQGTQTTVAEEPKDLPVQETTLDEPFLKAKTGTVYKTREDAELGIQRKDELISQLRNQVQQATGSDPLRQVRKQDQEPLNYAQNQDKYFEDIADAVNRKDTAAYMKVQQQLILDTMSPMAPALINLNKANAERVVAEQYPEFRQFLGSEQFQDMETESPLLIDAIRQAEGNPAAAAQLPELYRIAYLASQGRRVPEIVQSVQNRAQATPRPTVHSTPVPPPANTGRPVAQPSLDTREGRKTLIDQMESKGVMDLKW
jgi:hypothetical protein